MAISRQDVCSCTADRWMLPGDSHGPNGPRNDRKKSKYVPITVSLRGVLQSAADFSIAMIAGGNHTLIKEADMAISRYDVCYRAAVRWMVPGDSHGPNGPRNDRKNGICTDYRVIARSEATWQSPGTMFVTAQQIDRCYQEIPTGLTALGMTLDFFGDPERTRFY